MTEQVSSMECDAFHATYLSDKIPEAVFHGQAVKTVAYLRVSTAQQDLRSQRLAILTRVPVARGDVALEAGGWTQVTKPLTNPARFTSTIWVAHDTRLGKRLQFLGSAAKQDGRAAL